jgi:beta-phosphoglucomutase-like phosphatase (HAD superfamily)
MTAMPTVIPTMTPAVTPVMPVVTPVAWPEPVDALLLDFDGLICDTERAAHRSWESFYERHGLAFPDEVWAAIAGRVTGESYAAGDLGGRIGRELSDAELAERRREKSRLADAEPLRPGVARLLGAAARRGIRCAVVSSANPEWVLAICGGCGCATGSPSSSRVSRSRSASPPPTCICAPSTSSG